MNVLRESMTRIVRGSLAVRIWRQEKLDGDENNSDLFAQPFDYSLNPTKIALQFLSLPRVNAVEVLDISGCGTVIYANWP